MFWRRQKRVKLLMVGLDAAGKTTIQFRLSATQPNLWAAIGFKVDEFDYRNFHFISWDLGGQDKIRPLWRHYYPDVQGIIFVVDSNDRERLDDVRQELVLLLSEQLLSSAALVVLANKQDLPNAMPPREIEECLELAGLLPRAWCVKASSATNGLGLNDCFDWLHSACSSKLSMSMPQAVTYHPGVYTARVRLRVLTYSFDGAPCEARFLCYLPVGTVMTVREVAASDDGWETFGRIEEPVVGWVTIAAQGSGEHARQPLRIINISCETGSGSICTAIAHCKNLAGEELATLTLDDPVETTTAFRVRLANELRLSASSIQAVTHEGQLLHQCEPQTLISDALGLPVRANISTYSSTPQADTSASYTCWSCWGRFEWLVGVSRFGRGMFLVSVGVLAVALALR